MKQTSYVYGKTAEDLAMIYFENLGFQQIARRYKSTYGEIDLIVFKEKLLVFVEVKARNNPMHLELVSSKQITRYCNAAKVFLSQHDSVRDYDMRFDYIYIESGEIKEHIENAWECMEVDG